MTKLRFNIWFKNKEKAGETGPDDNLYISALLVILYACLCILGFRFFMKVEMNTVLAFLLVNLSTFWGVMACRGSVYIFKSIYKKKGNSG